MNGSRFSGVADFAASWSHTSCKSDCHDKWSPGHDVVKIRNSRFYKREKKNGNRLVAAGENSRTEEVKGLVFSGPRYLAKELTHVLATEGTGSRTGSLCAGSRGSSVSWKPRAVWKFSSALFSDMLRVSTPTAAIWRWKSFRKRSGFKWRGGDGGGGNPCRACHPPYLALDARKLSGPGRMVLPLSSRLCK
jgi:hypothetical protein